MRFIIASHPSESTDPGAASHPAPDEALLTAYMKFNEEMHKAGVLVASEGLNPGGRGARIAARNGKRTVVDGPFAESKELVGGFYIIDVPSLDEAVSWALRCPTGLSFADVLDIRPLTTADDLPAEMLAIIRKAAPGWSATFHKKA